MKCFRKFSIGVWISNRDEQLFRFLYENKVADAILELEIKGRTFRLALEYECARKYVNRYECLLRNYYHFQIAGILYICSNDALLKRIRSIEARTIESKDRKFYYSDFSKWKQGQAINFTNLSGVSIPLNPMTCAYESVVSPHHLHLKSVSQKSLNLGRFEKREVLDSAAD